MLAAFGIRLRPAGKSAGRRVIHYLHTLVTIASLDHLRARSGGRMIKLLQGVGVVSFSCVAISFAVAQTTSTPPGSNNEQAASNPVRVRLEGQLAALSRGAGDPRAEQVKRSRRRGCQAAGGARPHGGAIKEARLRRRRVFCAFHRRRTALSADQLADSADARQP